MLANNKSGSSSVGPLIKATINDGSGSFSVNGLTTVAAWTAGMVQVDVSGIETAAPLRQIHLQCFCYTTDVGIAIPLNNPNATDGGQGLYTNASQSSSAYGEAAAGTSGTITFDNLTLGTNTLTGTFSYVAKRQDGASVTVSGGTFGK